MDKLRAWNKKGVPAVQELFGYLQDTYTGAFQELLTGLGASQANFILYGCDYTETATEYNVNSGAVVLSGELLIVDSHTVTKQSLVSYYWDVEETDYPEGQMDFFGGTSNNIYAKRRGVVKKGTLSTGHGYMLLNSPVTLPDVLDSLIGSKYLKNQNLSFMSPSLVNGWVHDLSNNRQGLVYTKQQNGMIRLQGFIKPTDASGFLITTLPADVRPPYPVESSWIDLAGKKAFLAPNGELTINNYNTADSYYFIDVEYPTI